MPDFTKNLKLEMPHRDEQYDVNVWNENMEILDEAIGTPGHAETADRLKNPVFINDVEFDGSKNINIRVGIEEAPEDDQLYARRNATWVPIEEGGITLNPPDNVINFGAFPMSKRVELTWGDPVDRIIAGEYVVWHGTRLVRKVGSPPTNESDGVVVLTSLVRDQYRSEPFVDTGLVNGTTYFYQAFPYSIRGAMNRNPANRTSATPFEQPTGNLLSFTGNFRNRTVLLNWIDPIDDFWVKTKIMRKLGGYPSNENDGDFVTENTIRDEHRDIPYVDAGLVNGTTYYYQAFPYAEDGSVNRDPANRYSVTPNEIPTGPVTELIARVGLAANRVSLLWTDPTDDFWLKTLIRRKTGGYPEDENDGDLVTESFTRNQYITNYYNDNGLINGVTYYYRAFPYAEDGSVNRDATSVAYATPRAITTYGIRVLDGNPNYSQNPTVTDPAKRVLSSGTSVNASNIASAEIYREFRPCLFKNGKVNYYLNPNNFALRADGTASDITSGDDGDVMIEIPRLATSESAGPTTQQVHTGPIDYEGQKPVSSLSGVGEYLNWSITNRYSEGLGTDAFRDALNFKDFVYIGAYLGYVQGDRLRSLSGKTPTVSRSRSEFRTLARANGDGYNLIGFHQVYLLQLLYLIGYRHGNGQARLGGYTSGSALAKTGTLDANGMFYDGGYPSVSSNKQMKFAGIEDFWGNARYWVDGIYLNSTRELVLNWPSQFKDTDSGYYTQYPPLALSNISGYLNRVSHGKDKSAIFFMPDRWGDITPEKTHAGMYDGYGNPLVQRPYLNPTPLNGSSTTYFCDQMSISANCGAAFGGAYNEGTQAGPFSLKMSYSPGTAYPTVGARLMYL